MVETLFENIIPPRVPGSYKNRMKRYSDLMGNTNHKNQKIKSF
nr:MAG TPA: hypothetical protein [Caudoviricetes sp.]